MRWNSDRGSVLRSRIAIILQRQKVSTLANGVLMTIRSMFEQHLYQTDSGICLKTRKNLSCAFKQRFTRLRFKSVETIPDVIA